MKKSKRFAEEELERRIRKYGKPVLSDRCFLAAEHQKHHFRTSVASHSRQVALYTLKICRALQANGIAVDEEMAVRAALCHDLGIVGRKQKYKNNYECLRRHPVDSVEVAKRIFPQMDLRME